MLSTFSCAYWPFVYWPFSVEELFIQILGPFLNWGFLLLLSWKSSLCIPDTRPLPDIWFANIFSHSVSCIFILLIISFAMQKPFSLMWSHLFTFPFVAYDFGVIRKKSFWRPVLRRLPPLSSSRSFMVSNLTYKPLIHFELIFVNDIK